MPYFERVDSYDTYNGYDSDFHYDYNANSGGGQAFLGGTFIDKNGITHSPKNLAGSTASFRIRFRDRNDEIRCINLDADETTRFPITPRGAGSQNMKLSLENKTRPSLLIPAFLMMPDTCGRNMANSLNVSPLTTENYWLRSMRLELDRDPDGTTWFIPLDYIFEGGCSKKKDVSSDGIVKGIPVYFRLNYERRINDILLVSDAASTLPPKTAAALKCFKEIYSGITRFDYDACTSNIREMMSELAHEYPEQYSGISDPLPLLMSLFYREGSDKRSSLHIAQEINYPYNYVFFGAPGTGKSYLLNKIAQKSFDKKNIRRVTFYPDYTYSQFVGSFKPHISQDDTTNEESITYRFVPGPFMETYLAALAHPNQNYLLIIEEINRANPAATFGDVFQLLDRDANGRSEYSITVPLEMKNAITRYWLTDGELSFKEKEYAAKVNGFSNQQEMLDVIESELRLPSNMYIWATMNSADQGVFPMDTAFKRRWEFRYMDINGGSSVIADKIVTVAGATIVWDKLRRKINDLMIENKINEDKLLGPFFISPDTLNDKRFIATFKDKVLLYLYEDAGKMKRRGLFANEGATYSDLCKQFEKEGVAVFKGIEAADLAAYDATRESIEESED